MSPARMEKLYRGNISLDCVSEFCTQRVVFSTGGSLEAGSLVRVRSGWKKFRELLPSLKVRELSLCLKGEF